MFQHAGLYVPTLEAQALVMAEEPRTRKLHSAAQ